MKVEQWNILKRLTSINGSFTLHNDSITVLGADRVVLAKYTPNDMTDFGVETPLINVGEFLSILNVLDNNIEDVEINSNNDIVELKSSNGNIVKYLKTNSEYIEKAPDSFFERVDNMTPLCSFNITKEEVNKILKISSLISTEDLRVMSENGELTVTVLNSSTESNSFNVTINTDDTYDDFTYYISIKYLNNIQADDYIITVYDSIVQFKVNRPDVDLVAYVATMK